MALEGVEEVVLEEVLVRRCCWGGARGGGAGKEEVLVEEVLVRRRCKRRRCW